MLYALCFIPKGIYRFMTHAEANQHQMECLANGMARIALERSKRPEEAAPTFA